LSISSTNLAAVSADDAIIRKPVLTLFRQRPPEVGVPSENPKLDEPGFVITDFVDRVGDPVAIEAADGSAHRSEALAADALRALAYTATGGRPLPESVALTYPAHWGRNAVDELGSALSRVSEWSNRARPLTLIRDAAAALFAVRVNTRAYRPAETSRCAISAAAGPASRWSMRPASISHWPHGPASRLLRRPARSGVVDGRHGGSMLSGRLRVLLSRRRVPGLMAAIGGALRAAVGPGDTDTTTG